MKETIVKVQRSLASSSEEASILIYNEDRDILEEINEGTDPEKVSECMSRLGNRPKAYFNAQMNETGIKLLEEVEAQDF